MTSKHDFYISLISRFNGKFEQGGSDNFDIQTIILKENVDSPATATFAFTNNAVRILTKDTTADFNFKDIEYYEIRDDELVIKTNSKTERIKIA